MTFINTGRRPKPTMSHIDFNAGKEKLAVNQYSEQSLKKIYADFLNSTEIVLGLQHVGEALALLFWAIINHSFEIAVVAIVKLRASIKHLWHLSQPYRPLVRCWFIKKQLKRLAKQLSERHAIYLDTTKMT